MILETLRTMLRKPLTRLLELALLIAWLGIGYAALVMF